MRKSTNGRSSQSAKVSRSRTRTKPNAVDAFEDIQKCATRLTSKVSKYVPEGASKNEALIRIAEAVFWAHTAMIQEEENEPK